MKFFIPLSMVTEHGGNSDPYASLTHGAVYGPYESNEEMQKAFARLGASDRDKKLALVFDGHIMPIEQEAMGKPESEKSNPGNMDNYIADEDNIDKFRCKKCHAVIMGAVVSHPIHLRSMPGAGSGQCQRETVPYCPNCETKPDPYGAPVYE